MTSDAMNLRSNAANIQNNLTRAYTSMVNLSDGIGGLDADISGCLGMNSSIMGGGFGNGYGVYGGYGPGSECQNMTQKQYLAYQEELENLQIEKQIRQKDKIEYAEFKSTASKDAISREIGVLHDQILDNKQDRISDTYGRITNAVREKFKEAGYTEIPEDQVKAYAEKLYYEATGARLTDDIRNHGDNSFVKGLKDGAFGLGWLLNDKTSREENISSISGEEVSNADQFGLWSGRILAGAGSLVALPFVLRGGKGTAKALGNVTKNSWKSLAGKGTVNASQSKELTEILSKLTKDPKELEGILKQISKIKIRP